MKPDMPEAPFSAVFPVQNADDVRRLESVPLDQRLRVRSTYEVFANAAAAFGERAALSFLHTSEPDGPVTTWSFAELLRGIHRMANVLHGLGVGPGDTVAVLLPGCLTYHLALWGGAAAGIVQPLNPLLADDKLVALLNAGQARVLIAWGADDDSGYWRKAQHLQAQVRSLRHVLRVRPLDEPSAPASLAPGVIDCDAALAAAPHDRLLSARVFAPEDICAYFHTGGTTGAPKLARHSHGAQVFMAWSYVQMQGLAPGDAVINGFPLFHVAGVLPGTLAALSAGVHVIIPTLQLFRNRSVIRNYWKLVARHRPTALAGVSTVLTALTEIPLDGADISSLRPSSTSTRQPSRGNSASCDAARRNRHRPAGSNHAPCTADRYGYRQRHCTGVFARHF